MRPIVSWQNLVQKAGALKSDMVKMQDDVARLELAMDEMTQRENQAKASLEAFKELVQKFQGLIDAGTLRVKVVDGLMIVELATDILFPPGKDALSKEELRPSLKLRTCFNWWKGVRFRWQDIPIMCR